MHTASSYLSAALLVVASILIPGCGDSSGPDSPQTGTILIIVVTASTAADVDPDGYSLTLDDVLWKVIAVDAITTIGGLPLGSHLVRLDGLAANCAVIGANPLSVDVGRSQSTTQARFSVLCGLGPTPGPWDY